MAGWRFAADMEVADKKDERHHRQSHPADDSEAVHESEQPGLLFKLRVVVQVGSLHGVGLRIALVSEIGCHVANGFL